MAKFTTAFSLSHDVLNEIESQRGNENRSAFVDSVLKKALGITEREIEELRLQPASEGTGDAHGCEQ